VADKPVTRLASEMATQKKKRGFFNKVGGFLADAGQEVGRMVTNPVETVQRLGSEAKSTFYDPIRNLPNAFDPTIDMSAMDRVNTGLGGGLALADVVTPFVPEGALANAMVQRAAERAAVGTGERSFEYGLHHSLTPGIKTINPSRRGFQVTAQDAKPGSTYFWQGAGRDMSDPVKQGLYSTNLAVYRRGEYIAEPASFYQGNPRLYVTRVPKEGIMLDENVANSAARRIEQPLKVVSEIDPMQGYDDLASRLQKYGLGMQNYPEQMYLAQTEKIKEKLALLKNYAEGAARREALQAQIADPAWQQARDARLAKMTPQELYDFNNGRNTDF
jgi:hypothetical protein